MTFPRVGGWQGLLLGMLTLVAPVQADEATDAIVLISTESSRGTGFVCSLAGTNYILTNTHVLEGARRYSFTTLAQKQLSGLRLELAHDRDLARIQIAATNTAMLLPAPKLPGIGDPITVLGNSEGMSTITKLTGKVAGVGPNFIEVDAQFVSGNSGSPILNGAGQVVGVATFVARAGTTNWVNEGTRFDKPRRFGVRLDGVKWVPMSLPQFHAESSTMRDFDQFLQDSAKITQCLRQRQWEELVSFSASRRGNSPALYADPQYANLIANFGQSLRAAAEAARQGLDIRSGRVAASLQMAETAFQRFPDVALTKLKQTRWSTEHYQKKAAEYEQVFTRWKNATKENP